VGRKAGLTKEDVVAAAARLADQEGLECLSMAAVAALLGVQPPSLYHHVDGLDELRHEVAIFGARELGARFRAALEAIDETDEPGVGTLAHMARAFRAFSQEHPGLYAAAQPATSLDEDQALYAAAPEAFDTVLAAMAAIGLTAADQVHVIRSVRAALHGFIILESRPGFGVPDDVDRSFDLMLELLQGGVQIWVDETRRGLRG
jgi:AcrR family transcriptional regulator